jgi:tetratricopeptide (TPR) repeat protein
VDRLTSEGGVAKSAKALREQIRQELFSGGMPAKGVAVELASRLHVRPRVAWRYAMGWPQWKLVQEFRVANPHVAIGENRVSEWESWPFGGTRPSLEVLAALASAFGHGCLVADLLDEADLDRMSEAERRLVTTTPAGAGPASLLRTPTPVRVTKLAPTKDAPASVFEGLGRALTAYAPTGPSPSVSERGLRTSVAAAFTAFQASNFELAAMHATKALGMVAAVDPSDRDSAFAYQIAAALLSKTGRAELSWIAADRGVAAANRSGDLDVHASLIRTTAFAMAASGRPEEAIELIARAAGTFQPEMARSKASASVYGTMLLTGAVISAGQGGRSDAETYLDEADAAASVVGYDGNELWTAFGPTNVAIHRANVAAAVSDMDTVLSACGSLQVDHMPTERRVRLHLDVARASLAVGDREDALATLVRAEASAPSQIRHHRITKDVVNSLVETATRRPGVELTRLAHAVGVPV